MGTIDWFQDQGRTTNAIGLDVTTFSYPKTIKASVQPISRTQLLVSGLDLNNDYVNVYLFADVEDLERDISGDQFEYNGYRYQVQTATEWRPSDQWKAIIGVKIGPALS